MVAVVIFSTRHFPKSFPFPFEWEEVGPVSAYFGPKIFFSPFVHRPPLEQQVPFPWGFFPSVIILAESSFFGSPPLKATHFPGYRMEPPVDPVKLLL